MAPSFLQSYLPSLTSDPNAKENYFFIRDVSALIIFPQTVLENGSSSSPSVPFAPLLLVWLDSERRRSRFRIYVEILEALRRGPMTPYEVSFYLRLNSKRTREYVEFLIKKGFLESTTIDGKTVCTVTESGKVLADSMKTILDKE